MLLGGIQGCQEPGMAPQMKPQKRFKAVDCSVARGGHEKQTEVCLGLTGRKVLLFKYRRSSCSLSSFLLLSWNMDMSLEAKQPS